MNAADSGLDVATCYLWQNGMVMTFGVDGEQIPDLQGRRTDDLSRRIRARSTPSTRWIGWGEDGPATWPAPVPRGESSEPAEGAP